MRIAQRELAGYGDHGFTLAELVIIILIIGILLAIVLPVLVTAVSHAAKKTCFTNQRAIEGCVAVWQTDASHDDVSTLAGVVTATHELVTGRYLLRAPRCPSAPTPANPLAPTAAEGAYTLTATGTVAPCVFGDLGPHGYYQQ